ncbi:MAG: DUF3368 domain-containing protein [Tunicatimonas sp.]|uniref:DUF3368 domain-containing protein n=1 Tax=Tunicatimonas sp. TaxID=1940096 RepID=UPI003C70C505
MNREVIISDTSPIFSLALIDKLHILAQLFSEVYIAKAVWEELTRDTNTSYYQNIVDFFQRKVKKITGFNDLTFVMDYGESESVILYKELNADFLLIDDLKARRIAENFNVKCIGTIGLLSIAKENGLITELKPLFETFLNHRRYYSLNLLNAILKQQGEPILVL